MAAEQTVWLLDMREELETECKRVESERAELAATLVELVDNLDLGPNGGTWTPRFEVAKVRARELIEKLGLRV